MPNNSLGIRKSRSQQQERQSRSRGQTVMQSGLRCYVSIDIVGRLLAAVSYWDRRGGFTCRAEGGWGGEPGGGWPQCVGCRQRHTWYLHTGTSGPRYGSACTFRTLPPGSLATCRSKHNPGRAHVNLPTTPWWLLSRQDGLRWQSRNNG